jgi:hypothetical protein
MQARDVKMTAGQDEAERGQVEPPTRERTPRFKLIKLEERIAPGGGNSAQTGSLLGRLTCGGSAPTGTCNCGTQYCMQ